MKKIACSLLAAIIFLLLLGTTMPVYAWSRGRGYPVARSGGHFRAGVFIGVPLWWGPGWWGAPYPYYGAPPVVVEREPQVYVQPEPQGPQPYYWYYCQNPQGYYPYVQQCPGGWMTVVPPAGPPGPPGR